MVGQQLAEKWQEFTSSAAEALKKVSPGSWTRPAGYEGWSAHDLLAHLSSTQQASPRLVEAAFIESGPPGEPFDENRWNASQIRRRRDRPETELIEEFLSGASDLNLTLRQRILEPSDLDRPVHAGAGRGHSLRETFETLLDHQRGHLVDLLKAVRSDQEVTAN